MPCTSCKDADGENGGATGMGEEDSVARTPCFDQLPFLLRPRGPDRALLLYECARQLLVVPVFVIDFHTEAQSCTGREHD